MAMPTAAAKCYKTPRVRRAKVAQKYTFQAVRYMFQLLKKFKKKRKNRTGDEVDLRKDVGRRKQLKKNMAKAETMPDKTVFDPFPAVQLHLLS